MSEHCPGSFWQTYERHGTQYAQCSACGAVPALGIEDTAVSLIAQLKRKKEEERQAWWRAGFEVCKTIYDHERRDKYWTQTLCDQRTQLEDYHRVLAQRDATIKAAVQFIRTHTAEELHEGLLALLDKEQSNEPPA